MGVFGLLLVPRDSEDLGLKEGMNSSAMVAADAAYASPAQHAKAVAVGTYEKNICHTISVQQICNLLASRHGISFHLRIVY